MVTIFMENYHMEKKNTELPPGCKVSITGLKDVQDIMGGKWKYRIVAALYFVGKMRFMDLKRHIDDVAPKVLSKELKDLEMNQLVTRTVCSTKPITVEYALTALGESMQGFIQSMADWGVQYRHTVIKKPVGNTLRISG